MDKIKGTERIRAEFSSDSTSSDPFAAAVKATRMPMVITDPNQHDNPIVFVNDAFLKLTGYDREEIVGKNCRFLQGPRTKREDVEEIKKAIERRVTIEIDLLNHKKNGEAFWNWLLISPVFDENGHLTYFFASQFDVTLEREKLIELQEDRDALEAEVERRTRDLRQSEERLRFIVKSGRFGAWTLELEDRRLLASDMCKENFGRSPGDPFSYADLLSAILPEDRPRMEAKVASSIAEQTDYDIEYRILTPAGEIRWLQIRGQTFYRNDGKPISMAGVSIDITERKKAEEHRALLADELNHRVKNSMATVQAIASQTLRNASSLGEAQHTLSSRLISLSAAHDVLTRDNWEGADLSDVLEGALHPFQAMTVDRFRKAGPRVKLTPPLALAVAMAFHELATNAVKYGALSNETGSVDLTWGLDGAHGSRRLWMKWQEVRGPVVTQPKRVGFGTRMIERSLATELRGHARIDYYPDGVVFTLDAPLPEDTLAE